jgi:hypothetical protein
MPDKISSNAGLIDGIQAAARYLVVIVTAITAILGLVKTHDIARIINYIQANGGTVFAAIAGLIGLATAAYGVIKTQKRGTQVANAAAEPAVQSLELKQ